jgi:hypothetical protein
VFSLWVFSLWHGLLTVPPRRPKVSVFLDHRAASCRARKEPPPVPLLVEEGRSAGVQSDRGTLPSWTVPAGKFPCSALPPSSPVSFPFCRYSLWRIACVRRSPPICRNAEGYGTDRAQGPSTGQARRSPGSHRQTGRPCEVICLCWRWFSLRPSRSFLSVRFGRPYTVARTVRTSSLDRITAFDVHGGIANNALVFEDHGCRSTSPGTRELRTRNATAYPPARASVPTPTCGAASARRVRRRFPPPWP